MNLNNMSKEELMQLLVQTQNKLESVNEENKRLSEQLEKEKAEKRALNIRLEQLIEKYETKMMENRQLQVLPFLPKSEKLDEKDSVINEIEVTRSKRKTPTENFVEQLKKAYHGEEDVIIEYDFTKNGVNPDGVKLFGYDETYKLEVTPPQFTVKRIVRNKYRDAQHIYEADCSSDPFPHSPLTPSLAANILTMKYILGVPFYRYSRYLSQSGMEISEANICHWAERSMVLLDPLYTLLTKQLLNNTAQVIHIDETPLKVINEPKEKCYVFVYTTSFWDNPVYIYRFCDTRSTAETRELLKDYKGTVICDGYTGYDSLSDMGIKIQRCFVHARRYFVDVYKGLPEEMQKASPAYQVVKLMAELFRKEEGFRKKKLTAEQIRKKRSSREYRVYIEKLDRYIESTDTSNSDSMKKAVNYYRNNREELYTYLENGYVDMSNNLAERTVKPFVIARKNFLFCKTSNGAEVTSKLFSIVQTARANGLKPEEYLSYCLKNALTKKPEELLPWSLSLPESLRISAKDIE